MIGLRILFVSVLSSDPALESDQHLHARHDWG